MSEREKLIEAMARAQREAWRDREGLRDVTMEWEDIEKGERADCLADANAALAAIEAAGCVVVPRGLLEEAECWLTAALDCKKWVWDFDQHEAATETRDGLKSALAASPYAPPKEADNGE